jgi:hypothetical protein
METITRDRRTTDNIAVIDMQNIHDNVFSLSGCFKNGF